MGKIKRELVEKNGKLVIEKKLEDEIETARITLELSKETAEKFYNLSERVDMKKKELAEMLIKFALEHIEIEE